MPRHLSTEPTTSNFTTILTVTLASLLALAATLSLLFFSPAGTDKAFAQERAAAPSEAEVAAVGADAEATIDTAHGVLASAASKVDTTALEARVTQLAAYKVLSVDHVVALTDDTRSTTQQTADAVAAADAQAAAAAAAEAAAAQAAADEAARVQAAQAAEAARAQAAEAAAAEAAQASTPDGARALGATIAASQHGWGADQFACLNKLWTKESGWKVNADNPSSSAYGIPQALPGKKMASAGGDWATSARTQIVWGLGYIKSVYGTPCAAWGHSVASNWY